MIKYVWLVPLFPLLGVIINGIFASKWDKEKIGAIACAAVGLSFVISVLVFLDLIKYPHEARSVEVIIYNWIKAGSFSVNLGFLVDPLSVVMMMVVAGVSFVIHIYSLGYMEEDPGYRRYFVCLNLFVFAMLLLVSANNFLLMFVGWEGVGLCSYLLIGHWFERKEPADAGKKAFIVNRIGDCAFILGLMLMFWTFGTLNYKEVFEKAAANYHVGSVVITAITLLLFAGATGKSAQIPLYVWLPDAMEGPTPVSALIHAATMVTAGVYMVVRSHTLYLLAPISMNVVAIIGGVTALYSATIALTQNDIKRVLAYSTISQLGYMFLAAGVASFSAAIFHLMTHAFFKALLFLCAGSVMHALAGELDMRKMGGLKEYMPITHMTFLIATLAIAGIPPFAGFFSKDEILWGALSHKNYWLWAIGVFTAGLTAFYMGRALYMTFYGETRMTEELKKHVHESPPVMSVPLIILGILSVIGGFVGIPLIEGANVFHKFLEPVMTSPHIPGVLHEHLLEGRTYELGAMGVSIIFAIFGLLIAYTFYLKNPQIPETLAQKFKLAYTLLLNKYYVDEIYNFFVVQPIKNFSIFLWLFVDDKIIDGCVNGAGYLAKGIGSVSRRIESGYVQSYMLSILIGAVILLGYYLIIH